MVHRHPKTHSRLQVLAMCHDLRTRRWALMFMDIVPTKKDLDAVIARDPKGFEFKD